MHKAFVDHLRMIFTLKGAVKVLRPRLNHAILINQATAVTTQDPMERIICVRRLVLAELSLRILKQAGQCPSFASYLDEISQGTFSFCVDISKECPVRVPEEYTRNPLGPFWVWLATKFLAIETLRFSGPAQLEVGVLFNLRYKGLCNAIVGYPKRTAPYFYGFSVRRPLIRFADIWYTGSCFPCGGLPKRRLVDAEVSPAVFDSEV